MDVFEFLCCRKAGYVFSCCGLNVVELPKAWLHSSVNQMVIEMNPAFISQSAAYWQECFLEECAGSIPQSEETGLSDLLEWSGFILTYIQFTEHISGAELWRDYDIVRMMGNYDTLHTLSNQIAKDVILKDFSRANQTSKFN